MISDFAELLEKAEQAADAHLALARDLQTPTELSPAQLVIERSGYYEIRLRIRKRGVLGGPIMRGRSTEVCGSGNSPELALEKFIVSLDSWSGVIR